VASSSVLKIEYFEGKILSLQIKNSSRFLKRNLRPPKNHSNLISKGSSFFKAFKCWLLNWKKEPIMAFILPLSNSSFFEK